MKIEYGHYIYYIHTCIQIQIQTRRRRTKSIELYQSADPEWEVVLDFDALGAAEGESWVYKGNKVYDVSEVRWIFVFKISMYDYPYRFSPSIGPT
jgi:prolyl oligopeptidase PreP (S9A serine peptidase family)